MRGLFVLVLACVVGCGSEEPVQHQFMPDNNLWIEDSFDLVDANATEALFNKIIDIGYELYKDSAREYRETLTFSRQWRDPTVNASAWRDGRGATEVSMYGGMMRRPEVMPLGFALVMCHELNHLYGGYPYIQPAGRMSAEGQADWMGAGWCLRQVTLKLKDSTAFESTPLMNEACKADMECLQDLAASKGLGELLARLNFEPAPRYETPSKYVTPRTELSYASTQCRLDSYFNGVMGRERPLCWYKP